MNRPGRAIAIFADHRGFGLGTWTSIQVNCLSWGTAESVIARALAKKPEILFLDEPTGALDEETGRKILDYIWKKGKLGFTLIMVTYSKILRIWPEPSFVSIAGKITSSVTNDQPQTAYEIGGW